MKSYNLYTLIKQYKLLKNKFDIFAEFEQYNSQRETILKEKSASLELETIACLINIINQKIGDEDVSKLFEGFFYSYNIRQIAKEFDLIKANNEEVINIEIKSGYKDDDDIIKQLKQNLVYLKGASFKKIVEYSVMRQENNQILIRKLVGEELIKKDICDLCEELKETLPGDLNYDLDTKFDPSVYLVSPLTSPERFLNNEYFLTQQQGEIKKEIIESISTEKKDKMHIIEGAAGTGKTLLIYSIGISLSKSGKRVLIIHCGQITIEHATIEEKVKNLTIISIALINENYNLEPYDVIIIDEAQRISVKQFNIICSRLNDSAGNALMCYDKEQKLTETEIEHDQFKTLCDSNIKYKEYKLTNKIRTNKSLANFIKLFLGLKGYQDIKVIDASNEVKVYYVRDAKEARELAQYLEKEFSYQFIPFTTSKYTTGYGIDCLHYHGKDTHYVLGKEYAKVAMALGKQIEVIDGRLEYYPHPYSNYKFERLLLEGITRAQKSIALIIYDNPDLLHYTLSCIKRIEIN